MTIEYHKMNDSKIDALKAMYKMTHYSTGFEDPIFDVSGEFVSFDEYEIFHSPYKREQNNESLHFKKYDYLVSYDIDGFYISDGVDSAHMPFGGDYFRFMLSTGGDDIPGHKTFAFKKMRIKKAVGAESVALESFSLHELLLHFITLYFTSMVFYIHIEYLDFEHMLYEIKQHGINDEADNYEMGKLTDLDGSLSYILKDEYFQKELNRIKLVNSSI